MYKFNFVHLYTLYVMSILTVIFTPVFTPMQTVKAQVDSTRRLKTKL